MTRSTTAWFERNVPVWRRRASTKVVLPWSTWATIATLRRSARTAVGVAGAAESGTGVYCSKSNGTPDCPTDAGTWLSADAGRYTRLMTVAAVILSATTEGAVADTLGQPRVRRLADLAWSGGALPIVVLAPDPDGAVAAALVGSEAVYGSPAPLESGPVGQ